MSFARVRGGAGGNPSPLLPFFGQKNSFLFDGFDLINRGGTRQGLSHGKGRADKSRTEEKNYEKIMAARQ